MEGRKRTLGDEYLRVLFSLGHVVIDLKEHIQETIESVLAK